MEGREEGEGAHAAWGRETFICRLGAGWLLRQGQKSEATLPRSPGQH